MKDKLDAPIEVLKLCRRTYCALKRREAQGMHPEITYDPVLTVRQAVQLTDRDLRNMPNLGRVSIKELKDKLAAFRGGAPLSLNETVKTQRGYGEVVAISKGQACLRFADGRLAVYLITSLQRPDGIPVID